VSVRCPACHAELELVVAVAPASSEVEKPEPSPRWVLALEEETLAELNDEQRRAAGLRRARRPA
jgi:hypothetical protein